MEKIHNVNITFDTNTIFDIVENNVISHLENSKKFANMNDGPKAAIELNKAKEALNDISFECDTDNTAES